MDVRAQTPSVMPASGEQGMRGVQLDERRAAPPRQELVEDQPHRRPRTDDAEVLEGRLPVGRSHAQQHRVSHGEVTIEVVVQVDLGRGGIAGYGQRGEAELEALPYPLDEG